MHAQTGAPFIAMGASITEGAQSSDANNRTQPNNWAALVAQQLGVSFPLPLIQTSPTASVLSTTGRSRINPGLSSPDLGVSGAKVHDLLYTTATRPITTETGMVLAPRFGQTQMSIAQSIHAPLNMIEIGINDVDGAILSWNSLDASQMTSVASFTTDYAQMISLLSAMQTKVVVVTIPDITKITYMFGPSDLIRLIGTDCGLPQGSYTTLPTALLIKSGMDTCSILQNPSYVLDPGEIAQIQQRIQQFNQIIIADAAAAGFAVADLYSLYQQVEQNPPVFAGQPMTMLFLGGFMSLDGVHPSDTGQALLANAFIQAANQTYGMNIPALTPAQVNQIHSADPFVDWDADVNVEGRPLAGLLETQGPSLGISGDLSDEPPAPAVSAITAGSVNPALGRAFMRQYQILNGLPVTSSWTAQAALAAMMSVFPPQAR
jgi:lysophospholipase L1-like esterase